MINEPVAALTFDDGPDPQYTLRVLEILDAFSVKATFFVVGEVAQRYKELVKRIFHEGHVIGNHSWNHPSFTSITRKERRRQILACEHATAPYGHRILRPPWGQQSVGLLLDALVLRYEIIGWNLDVGDWWDNNGQRMAELLERRIRPGSVILLHDAIICGEIEGQVPNLHTDREAMLLALDSFLEKVSRKFSFATIPEMFKLGRPLRKIG